MWDAYRSTFIEPDIISPTPGSVSFSDVITTAITVLSSGASDETELAVLPYVFRNVTDEVYTTATSSTSWIVAGLTPETSYTFEVGVQDLAGNWATTTQAATTTLAETPIDATAPLRSAGQPSGSQSAGTTGVTLSVTTDEAATCKYSSSAGNTYDTMSDTFSTTGGTTHTATISGLIGGESYIYYVRCTDGVNTNSTDYSISFSVDSSASISAGYLSRSPKLSTNKPSPYVAIFTRNLKVGLTGNDVKNLQIFLNTHGYNVAPHGPGSLGQETLYFGPATQAALIRYQKANNITPAFGYFGPLTRATILVANPSSSQPSTDLPCLSLIHISEPTRPY